MNLHELKDTFKLLTGRYDLAEDESTDTLKRLINQACRALDRSLDENQKSWGVHVDGIVTDEYKLGIPYCRSIKEVWARSKTAVWQLEKIDIQDMIANYLSGDSISSGDPEFYSPVITRKIPESEPISEFSDYLQYMDTSTDLDYNFNAIVISPPTDSNLVLDVRGLFYSKNLDNDKDENYWSTVHPMTLLKAVARELEVFNQNTTKYNLWEKALRKDLSSIGKDLTEEIIAEVDQMDN